MSVIFVIPVTVGTVKTRGTCLRHGLPFAARYARTASSLPVTPAASALATTQSPGVNP